MGGISYCGRHLLMSTIEVRESFLRKQEQEVKDRSVKRKFDCREKSDTLTLFSDTYHLKTMDCGLWTVDYGLNDE